MEMTIDESISIFKNKGKYSLTEKENEAKRIAIDTMRKYKKIEEIAEKCNLKLLPKEAMSTFMKDVLEVLEDGNK